MGKVVKMEEFNVYDRCERHDCCTVEILSNSLTGQASIGWYPTSWHDAETDPPEEHDLYLTLYQMKERPDYGLLYDLAVYDPQLGSWEDSFYSDGNGSAIVKYWMRLPERPGEHGIS